jgi:hypothetical protein
MKKYSSNRAGKGKTAYRTPSRWLSGQPEEFKRNESRMKANNKKFRAHPGPFTH